MYKAVYEKWMCMEPIDVSVIVIYTVSQKKKLDPFHLSITLAKTSYFNNSFTVADRN